jgi:AmiR/NasT family two-component response regulator
VERAQEALEHRKLVERAKGVLMEALRLSEAEASRRIQRAARDHNVRLADVARQIAEQRSVLLDQASEEAPGGEQGTSPQST